MTNKSGRINLAKPVDILVVPDAHCKPGVSNERFEWLGKYVAHKKPDIVVCLGDFADMPSLCTYDRGKIDFEGRRYKNDLAATRDALHLLQKGMGKYNPRKIMLLGNHEHRINKALALQPELDGIISTDDLKYQDWGWEVFDFKYPVEINGVTFCHYMPSGVMGYPISGENAASKLIAKNHTSCVVGHSHLMDYAERTDPFGKRILGLSAGCFFEHDEAYAGPANQMYWRGVQMLRRVKDGEYDLELISMKQLKEGAKKGWTKT